MKFAFEVNFHGDIGICADEKNWINLGYIAAFTNPFLMAAAYRQLTQDKNKIKITKIDKLLQQNHAIFFERFNATYHRLPIDNFQEDIFWLLHKTFTDGTNQNSLEFRLGEDIEIWRKLYSEKDYSRILTLPTIEIPQILVSYTKAFEKRAPDFYRTLQKTIKIN